MDEMTDLEQEQLKKFETFRRLVQAIVLRRFWIPLLAAILVFVGLYALEGGQRLVSDTFKIDVPKELPEITLSASSRSVNEVKAIDIKTDILNAIKENR